MTPHDWLILLLIIPYLPNFNFLNESNSFFSFSLLPSFYFFTWQLLFKLQLMPLPQIFLFYIIIITVIVIIIIISSPEGIFFHCFERHRERERNGFLICARTGDQTQDPSFYGTTLQPTEPHWPGWCFFFNPAYSIFCIHSHYIMYYFISGFIPTLISWLLVYLVIYLLPHVIRDQVSVCFVYHCIPRPAKLLIHSKHAIIIFWL